VGKVIKSQGLRRVCNCQATEELAVFKKKVEKMKQEMQSRENKWKETLTAEPHRWEVRLQKEQQHMEIERDKMAEAVVGKICIYFWEREKNKLQFRE
jgi:hypothetical protein